MASRKERKEALRREREAAAAAAAAAERRRRLVGYGLGGLLAVTAIAVGVVLASGGGDGEGAGANAGAVYPDGGEVPARKVTDLEEAAKAAGCELRDVKVPDRTHVETQVRYPTKPPAGGNHNPVPADDGIYDEPPQTEALVHGLEHGRVIVWFKPRLPGDLRASLKAFFEEDPYQMFLTPDATGMPYELAATAWNGQPEPLGTGRLLGCRKAGERSFDALAAFREEHRSNGPEPVP